MGSRKRRASQPPYETIGDYQHQNGPRSHRPKPFTPATPPGPPHVPSTPTHDPVLGNPPIRLQHEYNLPPLRFPPPKQAQQAASVISPLPSSQNNMHVPPTLLNELPRAERIVQQAREAARDFNTTADRFVHLQGTDEQSGREQHPWSTDTQFLRAQIIDNVTTIVRVEAPAKYRNEAAKDLEEAKLVTKVRIGVLPWNSCVVSRTGEVLFEGRGAENILASQQILLVDTCMKLNKILPSLNNSDEDGEGIREDDGQGESQANRQEGDVSVP